jgi:hypothetical protein
LEVRVRVQPQGNSESTVFRPGDIVRVVVEVRNGTGLPLRDIRPDDLTIWNNDLDAGQNVFTNVALEGGLGRGAMANARGGVQGAAGAVGRGGPTATGGALAAGETAAPITYCVIQPWPIGGMPIQVRQVRGPEPLVISRLGLNQTATFTWDLEIVRFQPGEDATFRVGANVSGEFAGERIRGTFVSDPSGPNALEAVMTVVEGELFNSLPVERAIGCMFVTMEASPSQVGSGGVVEVRMRAHANSQFFPPRQYTDVFPTPLILVPGPSRGNEVLDVNLQLLSGPTNPFSGPPVNLGDNEVTYFVWRYAATGTGCFRLRGQLSARPLRTNITDFLSNHIQTNIICLPQGPRIRG